MESVDLGQYRWNNRLLLVFAPSAADEAYQQQEQVLEPATADLEERDMLIGALFEDREGTNRIGAQHLAREAAAALRQQLGIPAGQFQAVLIGKDGGVKERYTAPVSTNELFGVIDSMPMRQNEMQGK